MFDKTGPAEALSSSPGGGAQRGDAGVGASATPEAVAQRRRDEVAVGLLRKVLCLDGYANLAPGGLVLDGFVEVTDEERALIEGIWETVDWDAVERGEDP